MNRITLQQISELPDKERMRFFAYVDKCIGRLEAARQNRKKVMSAKTQIELGENDVN